MPKLTVEFSGRWNDMLSELAAKEGTTKVDVLRRALALLKYVEDEVGENDKRRLAIAEDDKVLKEIVLR